MQNINSKVLLDGINERIFHLENSYLLRREIHMHYNSAVSKEAADEFRSLINMYQGFFMPMLEGALAYTLVGLHALVGSYDKQSIARLIVELKAERKNDYTENLTALRTKHRKTLKSIKDLRHGHFAHFGDLDLDKVKPISEDDYISLFEDVKVVIQELNSEFGNTVIFFDGQARQTIRDTHLAMMNMLRGEKARIDQIDIDSLDKLYEHGKDSWLNSSY